MSATATPHVQPWLEQPVQPRTTADLLATPPWGFAEFFVISQTALPALLYLPGTQVFRLPIRVSSFAISLFALVWWRVRASDDTDLPRHPAMPWLFAVVATVSLMIFHPHTNSFRAGVAHVGLYVCILAPLFWAPAFVRSPGHLRRILALLLICNGVNAVVGVLQVYDPARWLPQEFSRLVTESDMGLGPVSYTGPNGELIVRPPGLFDTPGAVAGVGMLSALLGVIFGASRIPMWQRAASLGLAFASVAAIYLSQVRVSLVVLAGMMVAYGLLLARQRRVAELSGFATLSSLMLVGAFGYAAVLGGQSIVERVFTLFAENPAEVYYASRGGQLVYALNEFFFDFPFGAGLGRWGMTAAYFSDRSNLDGQSIWAEIQIAGWMIDGGFILLFLYCGALVATSLHGWRLAVNASHPLVRISAAVILAANAGTFALILSFTPFMTQIGLQFWFLAGALHGAVRGAEPA
ncbi:MAG TPA: hypothetical protein VH679_13915 [Vicinamibacterales bacterium]|jgi:hypothetical protein